MTERIPQGDQMITSRVLLVVEDRGDVPLCQAALAEAPRATDYQVSTVATAQAALAVLATEAFDVIVYAASRSGFDADALADLCDGCCSRPLVVLADDDDEPAVKAIAPAAHLVSREFWLHDLGCAVCRARLAQGSGCARP